VTRYTSPSLFPCVSAECNFWRNVTADSYTIYSLDNVTSTSSGQGGAGSSWTSSTTALPDLAIVASGNYNVTFAAPLNISTLTLFQVALFRLSTRLD
jgi:hypothetical protein